jgi:hypothetical protein
MLMNSNINKTAFHWKYLVAMLAITSGFQKTGVFKEFFHNKMYPKTSAGNTRPIAAGNSFVAQTLDDNVCHVFLKH